MSRKNNQRELLSSCCHVTFSGSDKRTEVRTSIAHYMNKYSFCRLIDFSAAVTKFMAQYVDLSVPRTSMVMMTVVKFVNVSDAIMGVNARTLNQNMMKMMNTPFFKNPVSVPKLFKPCKQSIEKAIAQYKIRVNTKKLIVKNRARKILPKTESTLWTSEHRSGNSVMF
jgi:hypothetical protein